MTPTTFQTPSAQYTVTSVLRESASASTYEVQRQSDGAAFVLKKLRIANLEHWKQFDLFEREVAALKAIEHPFVPRWVDSHLDEETGVFVSIQTLVRGTTLKQMIAQRGGLTAQEVDNYLRQALGILMHLHERAPQIIHRDINPSNVMVAQGQVYLIDFGAVKVGDEQSTSMTTVGTFGYMAPEQILGRASVQSDLYGLGMTMVTMATGLDPSAMPQNPSTGQVDPSSVLRAPPNLTRTLLALIRPGVAERPTSARVALGMLDQQAQAPVGPSGPPALAQPYGTPVGPYAGGPYGGPVAPYVHKDLSPYKAPHALTPEDKAYLRQHRLERFPTALAVLLHLMTFGIFSIIYYGLQHDRLPQAKADDPSAAKAIGFNFIPYFNLYWFIFQPMRLTDRLNLQDNIRDRENSTSRGLMLTLAILGMIPYINILIGIPLYSIGVYKLQRHINRLADEKKTEAPEPLALQPPKFRM
ncbi:MAG: serine/threonine-protein kinase [Myxococcota bacterium]